MNPQKTVRCTATALCSVIALLFLGLPLNGCDRESFLPGYPGARTILPAECSDRVYVLPDGRNIVYKSKDGSRLLDVATGEDVPMPVNLASVVWLDDELLYTPATTRLAEPQKHYVTIIRPLSAVELDLLPPDSAALSQYVRGADVIYAYPEATGSKDYRVLLLNLDPAGKPIGGQVIQWARNLDVLLEGMPYKTPHHPYYDGGIPRSLNQPQFKFLSPDGKYYYTCPRQSGLHIYTHEGQLLNSANVSEEIYCYGWAWDNSGVYFQEWNIYGGWGGPPPRWGPLELLPVRP